MVIEIVVSYHNLSLQLGDFPSFFGRFTRGYLTFFSPPGPAHPCVEGHHRELQPILLKHLGIQWDEAAVSRG